jgi:hypothetical protein
VFDARQGAAGSLARPENLCGGEHVAVHVELVDALKW